MKRFGKKRVPGCECTYNFTCGACLRDAPPPIFTGTTGTKYPRPPVDLYPAPQGERGAGRTTYDPKTLEAMPTLSSGQASDLKIDTGTRRVWLERCGPEDGETHQVTVEELCGGRWETVERLHPYQEAS